VNSYRVLAAAENEIYSGPQLDPAHVQPQTEVGYLLQAKHYTTNPRIMVRRPHISRDLTRFPQTCKHKILGTCKLVKTISQPGFQ
jgi:hypothetical protein